MMTEKSNRGNGRKRRVPVPCDVLIGSGRKSLGTVRLDAQMNAMVERYAAAKGLEYGEALQALLRKALGLVNEKKETP